MSPTTILILILIATAALLLGAWIAVRFFVAPEKRAAQLLERGLSFLLDDSEDNKIIKAAQSRKTARAALRAQALQDIATAIAAAGPAPAVPASARQVTS